MADIYSTELPARSRDGLQCFVAIAEKHKMLALRYMTAAFEESYAIMVPEGIETVSLSEGDLLGLKALDFLQIIERDPARGIASGGHIYLTEKAYDLVHHYRKRRLGRWWDKAVYGGKQAAPLIVSVAAVILTLLQIVQTVAALLEP